MSKAINALALKRRRIEVPVPGTDAVIVCRRPDLKNQVIRGLLPQPLVDAVMARAAQGTTLTASETNELAQQGEFIDRWICAAAVEPQIVLTEAEASDTAVWVDDLDFNLKLAIFHATVQATPPASAAVTDFRDGQSAGAGAGSNGTALSDAPVPTLTH